MAVKARLRVVLHAGDTVVAESDDVTLWQRVLATITGRPQNKMVRRVLRTIDLRDKNALHVVQEAEWAQLRGGAIVLNLARISRAVALARAFCAREWTNYRAG